MSCETSSDESKALIQAMVNFFSKRKVHNRAIKLTEKLMYILECLSAKFGTIISWSLDGKSVIVHNREAFVDIIIATFFKKGTFDSFCRKMRRWGFTTKNIKLGDDGEDKWAFHHPDFNKAGSFGCCERVMTASKKTKKVIGDLYEFSGYTRQEIHEGQINHSNNLMNNERTPENSESSNKQIPPSLFPSSIGATVEEWNVTRFADNKMSSTLHSSRNHEQLPLKDSFNAEPEMRREHDQTNNHTLKDNISSDLDPSLGVKAPSLQPYVPIQEQNHIGQSLLQNLFVPSVLGRNTMSPFQGNTAISNITQANLLLEIVRRQLISSQNHDNATLFPHALNRQYSEQFRRQHPMAGRLDDAVMWREIRIHGQINQHGQHDILGAMHMSKSQHLHEDLNQSERALQHRIGNAQPSRTQDNSSTLFRQVQRNNTVGSESNAPQLSGVVQQDMIPVHGSQGLTIEEYQILLQYLQRIQH